MSKSNDRVGAFCISHIKDVDGIGAAAIVRAATGAEVLLTDYETLLEDLSKVPDETEEFYLCDLGADNANVDQFVKALGDLSKNASATYIDHHYMSAATKRKLKAAGVKVVHDVKECSSMLAYLTLRERLPEGARLIALCGAVTDYMDSSKNASKLMQQADRQYVLLEAAMLSYALGNKGTKDGFPSLVASELSEMKQPHQIQGVSEFATLQLESVYKLGQTVKEKGTKLGRVAYMVTSQYSTGNVAKLLIGAFGVPVGIAMKEKAKGWYEVSLRGTSECKVHLGREISSISAKMGGSGGGHRLAAGCRIPVGQKDALIAALSKRA